MNIEVFYTGGGIWLAEAVINEEGDYAVIDSEYPECLSVYHKAENEEEKYMPEDMYISKTWDELPTELSLLHGRMFLALKKKCDIKS